MINKGNNSYIGSDKRNSKFGSYGMPKNYLRRIEGEEGGDGYDWRAPFYNKYSIALGESDNCSTFSSMPNMGFGLGAFTISCWFYIEGIPGSLATVFDFRSSNTSPNPVLAVGLSHGSRFLYGNGVTATTACNCDYPPNLRQWYHFCYTRSTTNWDNPLLPAIHLAGWVYLNGLPMRMIEDNVSYSPPSQAKIGINWHSSDGFMGKVDELAVFDYSFSQQQVFDLYNKGSPVDLSSDFGAAPIHWWRLGDVVKGAGTTVKDWAGGKDMTLNGGTFSSEVPTPRNRSYGFWGTVRGGGWPFGYKGARPSKSSEQTITPSASLITGTSQFTLSSWLKLPEGVAYQIGGDYATSKYGTEGVTQYWLTESFDSYPETAPVYATASIRTDATGTALLRKYPYETFIPTGTAVGFSGFMYSGEEPLDLSRSRLAGSTGVYNGLINLANISPTSSEAFNANIAFGLSTDLKSPPFQDLRPHLPNFTPYPGTAWDFGSGVVTYSIPGLHSSRSGISVLTGLSGVATTAQGTTNLNDGSWHNVALVYGRDRPGVIKLYVDGSFEASGNSVGPSMLTSGSIVVEEYECKPLMLGGCHENGVGASVLLNDVAIWTHSGLSEAEISEIYNGGSPPDLVPYGPDCWLNDRSTNLSLMPNYTLENQAAFNITGGSISGNSLHTSLYNQGTGHPALWNIVGNQFIGETLVPQPDPYNPPSWASQSGGYYTPGLFPY